MMQKKIVKSVLFSMMIWALVFMIASTLFVSITYNNGALFIYGAEYSESADLFTLGIDTSEKTNEEGLGEEVLPALQEDAGDTDGEQYTAGDEETAYREDDASEEGSGSVSDEGGAVDATVTDILTAEENDSDSDYESSLQKNRLLALKQIKALTNDAAPEKDTGYIVYVKPEEVSQEMIEAAPESPALGNLFAVDDPSEALAFADPEQIESIEPDAVVTEDSFPYSSPNDPAYKQGVHWNLNGQYGVDAPTAWRLGLNGAGARVAVIDSGIYAALPDYGGSVKEGYTCTGNVVRKDATIAKPFSQHGTTVSSIIGARANNGKNITGLAYNAEIVAFKLQYNVKREVKISSLITTLQYIVEHNDKLGIDVINMSVGAYIDSKKVIKTLNQLASELNSQGVIIAATAGNQHGWEQNPVTGEDRLRYPGACEGVIAVGGVTRQGVRASYSNVNSAVDIAAPTGVPALTPNGGYKIGGGTSCAAPHVAAVAAMVKGVDPSINSDEFLALLEETSTRIGEGKSWEFGYGLLNAGKIAEAVTENKITYSVEHFFDGSTEPALAEQHRAWPVNPGVRLDDMQKKLRAHYKAVSYTLNGEAVDAATVSVSENDVIGVWYEPVGLVYENGRWIVWEAGDANGARAKTGWETADENGETRYRYYDGVRGRLSGYASVPGIDGDSSRRQCWFDAATGYAVTGPRTVGAYTYYFDGVSGIVKAGGEKAPDGVFETADGGSYLIDENGRFVTGWDKEKAHYYDADGLAVGAKQIGKYWYWFDPQNGGALNKSKGWIEDAKDPDVRYYCYSASGYLQTGKYNGTGDKKTYYFDTKSAKVFIGQVKIGKYYYFFEGYGKGMVTEDERSVDGDRIYYYGKDGMRASGLVTFSAVAESNTSGRRAAGEKAYYTADGLYSGSKQIGKYLYWFDPQNDGAMCRTKGWINERYYCYSEKGYLKTNGAVGEYYVNKNGERVYGPVKIGKYVYFYDRDSGRKVTSEGWLPDRNDGYVTKTQGRLRTGLFAEPDGEGAEVYLSPETGAIVTGSVKIGGGYYYYDGENGRVKKTGWIDDKYYVGNTKTGKLLTGNQQVGGIRLYFNKDGALQTGHVKISGRHYYYKGKEGLVTKLGLFEDVGKPGDWYYCYSSKGWLRVGRQNNRLVGRDGKVYYFGKDARLVTGQVRIGRYYYCFEGRDGMVRNGERVIDSAGGIVETTGTVAEVLAGGNRVFYYNQDGRRASGKVAYSALAAANSQGRRTQGDVCYYSASGIVFGPKKIGSGYFFFDRRDGALVRATMRADGKPALSGAGQLTSGSSVSGNMPVRIVDGAKVYYTSRTDGRLMTGWQTIKNPDTGKNEKFYFNKTGAMSLNCRQKISGKWYTFDKAGVCL